jgi:hypothetical protein
VKIRIIENNNGERIKVKRREMHERALAVMEISKGVEIAGSARKRWSANRKRVWPRRRRPQSVDGGAVGSVGLGRGKGGRVVIAKGGVAVFERQLKVEWNDGSVWWQDGKVLLGR